MSPPAKGVVAAGHQLTAEAAAQILKSGGNACDAAITAAWMACLCEPVLASPGGGGFAMVDPGDRQTRLIDFFVQTPMTQAGDAEFFAAEADFGETRQTFHIGHGASATPGFVPGLFHLHEQCASLPMADLIAPAATAARHGIIVTPFQHFLSTVVAPILLASVPASALFAPGGDLIAAGSTFKNPGLADLLDLLAAEGLEAYDGAIRRQMLAQQSAGGHLTDADFAGYRVADRDPLKLALGDLDISLNPPPSSGGVLIAHTLSAMSGLTPFELARSLDHTDRQRRQLGGDLNKLIASFGPRAERGTTHISVITAAGDACAMTLSNGEGNGRIVGDFGFMINNMLGEEDVNPAGATGWPTNARLSSIMCPTIAHAENGTQIALGSGGSNRIRSAIAAVLCNLARPPRDVAGSITAPRMHIEAGHLDVEIEFGEDVLAQLQTIFPDHRIWPEPNLYFGGCHLAARHADGRLTGAGDPRRAGVCITV